MKPLSVLHISTADNLGGSGRSAYKIHTGLRRLGVQSHMLVGIKTTSDKDVDFISRRWWKVADKVSDRIANRIGLHYLFIPSSWRLISHRWFQEADVIQLYNTHGGYFSHSVLPHISRRKKVVWRLSDMWPLTGHCAYSGSCELWRTGCRRCPDLQTYPSLVRDTAGYLFRKKARLYNQSRIHIVAPSSWLFSISAESPLLGSFPRSQIPNGVNTQIFKPMSRQWCRTTLNIPQNRKAVLFLADVLNNNPRKGGDYFIRAINALDAEVRKQLFVMLVGQGADDFGSELKCDIWRHDLIREDELLAMTYNAADVLAHPAIQENLPNSVLEAMACGLPTVAFDTGGVRDFVVHEKTGYLARAKDESDLARGLHRLIINDEERTGMSHNCRLEVEQKYDAEKQAQAFYNLYRSLVTG